MIRPIRKRLRHAARPLCTWSAALLYLILVSGLPLPMSTLVGSAATQKDRSQPFPCMDSQCGCRTADQCWQSCCCHTPAERVAWARTHGVTLPECVLAQVDGQSKQQSACDEHGDCASCGAGASCCDTEEPASDLEHLKSGSSVVLIQALECQGIGTNWLAAAIAIPVVEFDLSVTIPAIEWTSTQPPHDYAAIPASPPVPPPRLPIA